MKYLKRANYEKIANNPKFKNAYLIQNKRTGQMAEIRAASAYHACNIIGWKANKVQVLQEREIKEETPVPSEPAVIVPETTGSSTPT